MKLIELPLNTLVELQFNYMDEKHMVSAGVLYKYANTLYVSAVKSLGETVPAKKLRNFSLIYKTDNCVYSFQNLTPRSTSYCGQKLYAIESDQEAFILSHSNAFRLFMGTPIFAKIIMGDDVKFMECILKDISMTGMGIVCKIKLDELAKIEISFRVNAKTNETLMGNIIHIRKFINNDCYLYGCEFDAPNINIGNYVAKRKAELLVNQE